MILISWFLDTIQDKQDLENYGILQQITPDDYKELKQKAKEYLDNKFYIMHERGNKTIANYLYAQYKKVMERVCKIEGVSKQ